MKYYLFFLVSFFLWLEINGQGNSKNITATYENLTLEEILIDINKTNYKSIYFLKSDLPILRFTIQFKNKPLSEIVNQLSKMTNLDFVSYRENIYFLMSKSKSDNLQDEMMEKIKQAEYLADNREEIIEIKGTPLKLNQNMLSGKVIDLVNSEGIIGATVIVNGVPTATTDENGTFNIYLENGINIIELSYIGFARTTTSFKIKGKAEYTFKIEKENQLLDEVVISSVAKDLAVKETQIGINRVDIKSLERLPTFLGERDVVKALLLNPGVSSIGEGASGFNVRGGNVDQNLILQDDAILFNASHALGFFSSFNADVIKSATLHKGALGASFGGRLASVLDINTRDGADQLKFKLSVSILSVTGTIDAPLGKNSNLLLSGRTTYSNFIFKLFPQSAIKNSKAGFYDFNAKWTLKSGKSLWTVSTYISSDGFVYDKQFGFDYTTKVAQLSWKVPLSTNVSNKLALVWSDYVSNQNDFTDQLASQFRTQISYFRFHDKLTAKMGKSIINAGLSSLYYKTLPGEFLPLNDSSLRKSEKLEVEKGIESALYINSETSLSKYFDIVVGIRLNHFVSIGPRNIFVFKDDIFTESNIIDTVLINGILKTYFNPELRFSGKINLSKNSSFKLGYARTTQYINQLFNTDTPSPSSQWQLSNQAIKPSQADNYSAGYFINLNDNKWELSVEAYYRNSIRVYDYKDFAKLFVNPHVETELLEGSGISKGIEWSMKKNKGKLNGFFSYTYSSTNYTIVGINNGESYSSNFDKPHNLTLVLNYQPIERRTFTANFSFSTGRPTTAPISGYQTQEGIYVPIYSGRNELRIPDTHRLDLSANFGRTHNKVARFKSSWTFTIYNVYGRKNPFSVFYTGGFRNIPQANRLALVGTIFPSLSFNVEFQ